MVIPLFKRNLKRGFKVMFIFIVIITIYTMAIIYMYNEDMARMLSQYQDLMPELMAAVGMTGGGSSLLEFINTYLNGFIMLIVPMVFTMLLVNNYLVKYVDSGSMACLLATVHSRKKIILTQIFSILLMITIFLTYATLLGIIGSELLFPGKLDIGRYILMNIATLFMQFMVGGICFFMASAVNETRWYLALGVGIPLAFYIIQMMANMGDKIEVFKYMTIYTLLPYKEIIAGDGFLGYFIIMILTSAVLFVAGKNIFIRKDLNL